MAGALYRHQLRLSWNHFDGALELFDRAEGVAGSMDEERGRAQVGEMLRALLFGASRRMKRVGQQKEPCCQVGLFGAEHAGLATSVGVTAEVEAAFIMPDNIPTSGKTIEKWGAQDFFDRGDGVLQARAVARGVSRAGRAKGTSLTKRQIAPQDGKSVGRKPFGQRVEQRGLGIAARAVGQD